MIEDLLSRQSIFKQRVNENSFPTPSRPPLYQSLFSKDGLVVELDLLELFGFTSSLILVQPEQILEKHLILQSFASKCCFSKQLHK
jgi:hypothetical protein